MQKKSVLIVGVGGQGTILTAKILVNGLIREGYDVKMSEVHGMSQRGGASPRRCTSGKRSGLRSREKERRMCCWLLKRWRRSAMRIC